MCVQRDGPQHPIKDEERSHSLLHTQTDTLQQFKWLRHRSVQTQIKHRSGASSRPDRVGHRAAELGRWGEGQSLNHAWVGGRDGPGVEDGVVSACEGLQAAGS